MLIKQVATMSNTNKDVNLAPDSECRCCLQKCSRSSNSYYLFQAWDPMPSWDCAGGTIATDLAKITNIQVSELDGFSKLICSGCCLKLQSACQFIWSVRINDQSLRQRYMKVPVDNIWPKPIRLENIHGNYVNMNIEIKQEPLSDEDNNMNETEGDMNMIAASDIKIEPEEIMEPLPIKVTVNGTITANQMKDQNQKLTNGSSDYQQEEYLDATVKEEPMSEDEDFQCIPPDLPLECMLCSKMFHSISGLKAHVIAQHSYKGVKRKAANNPSPEKKKPKRHICAICRRGFETSTDLMVHETCHNKCVCYGCHTKLDTFAQLTKHRKRCKASSNRKVQKPKTLEDVMRPLPEDPKPVVSKPEITFKCTKCSETFSDVYYMIIHNEIHHSDDGTEDNDDREKNKPANKNKQAETMSTFKNNGEIETKKLTKKNEESKEMVTDNSVRRNNSKKSEQENSEQKKVINECKMQAETLQSILDNKKPNDQSDESVKDRVDRINNSIGQSTNDLAINDDKMHNHILNENIVEHTDNNELRLDNGTAKNSSEKSESVKDETTILINNSMETETLVNIVEKEEQSENTNTEKNEPTINLDKKEVAGNESILLNNIIETEALEYTDKKEQNQVMEYKKYEKVSSEKLKQTNECPNLHKNRIEAEGLEHKFTHIVKEKHDTNEDTNNSEQNEQVITESATLNENIVETEIHENKSEHTGYNDHNDKCVEQMKDNDVKTVKISIEKSTNDVDMEMGKVK